MTIHKHVAFTIKIPSTPSNTSAFHSPPFILLILAFIPILCFNSSLNQRNSSKKIEYIIKSGKTNRNLSFFFIIIEFHQSLHRIQVGRMLGEDLILRVDKVRVRRVVKWHRRVFTGSDSIQLFYIACCYSEPPRAHLDRNETYLFFHY